MIPRLTSPLSSSLTQRFLGALLKAGFIGDVEAGHSSRTVYATDNSIYQIEPDGIAFPRNAEDLVILAKTLSLAEYRELTIAPRGGGTGTNGQSLTSGVVVDCSRHMNQIIDIDPVRRVARVQSGVVKDQLNRELKKHGLFFAPELSTSNRATIGGMVSTDACGQGSCLYGKTSNHILGLRVVLLDGTDWWSRPLSEGQLNEISQRADSIGNIHRTVQKIATEKRERINEVFPNLNRYMTGYDLAHIFKDDGRFDLNSILCGSEGTLALIAEIEVNLLPLPEHANLVNIRYGDFNAALEDAKTLASLGVASVETIDEKVLNLAKGDIIWQQIAEYFPEDIGAPANGINIVEIVAGDVDELKAKTRQLTELLSSDGNANRRGFTVASGHKNTEAIWTMRKKAVGLLGNVAGNARPVPFVEDTAVPPENLAPYIREFRALLDSVGVAYGMFGHVDAGVLHVRPALDLTTDRHIALVRDISDKVVALTRKYGGVLWGEHGKGVRSEYAPEFFGDLYPCLQDIKRAFDPDNRLNPGKIATATAEATLLKIDEVPLRGATDRQIGNDIRAAMDNATHCNGNGACFDFDAASAMCPSYKATRDRRFSPKGRAALMREWLRLLAEKDIDVRQEAAKLRQSSRAWRVPFKLFNNLNPKNKHDFSHEVREAMDSCLACKACAGQCPVKVSVPAFRAKFYELYYARYARPIKHHFVSAIETTLPLIQRLRPLYNLAVSTGASKALNARIGLTALPRLPDAGLSRDLNVLGVRVASKKTLAALKPEELARSVIILPDAFTKGFEPKVLVAALRTIKAIGFTPFLAPHHVNGKALHVHGYLGSFEKKASRTAKTLAEIAAFNVPIVGLDPSMTLTFRSEYQSLIADTFVPNVLLLQEWLVKQLDGLPADVQSSNSEPVRLFLHCTERTNAPASVSQWKAIFSKFGRKLEIVDSGCCGMAGTFGHETSNRAISEKLYDMSWREPISKAQGNNTLAATGYSCRSQVKEIGKLSIPHPIEVICEQLTAK